MTLRVLFWISLISLSGCQSVQALQQLPYAVGTQKLILEDHVRQRNLPLSLWYPAEGTSDPKAKTDGIYTHFYGQHHAQAKPGRHPLILMSHGTGGNASSISWIAEFLAGQGYWVVGVDHPKDSWPNATAEGLLEVWQRPQDLSQILNLLPNKKEIAPYIDFDKVAVLGHSSGGYTALALVGARYDVKQLEQHCISANPMPACALTDQEAIKRVDYAPSGKSYKDPRISAAVAIAPAVSPGLTDQSLQAIDTPTLFIFSKQDELLAQTPAEIAPLLINSESYSPALGGHFIYLSQCNDLGKRVAPKICIDAKGVERTQVHQQLKPVILDFLQRQFHKPSTMEENSRKPKPDRSE